MSNFYHRQLASLIAGQKNKFPVLVVTGPRQSGKTTMLKSFFSDYRYVNLENFDTLSFATNDPVGFLQRYDEKVIFDEIQRAPKLFSYIREKLDSSDLMGRYILSGSQNFHLIKNITEKLAGRVALFKLLPLDFQELKQAGLLANSYTQACITGGYPAIFDKDIDPVIFYSNYVQTYIEKDVTELLKVKYLKQFREFLMLCAARAGQVMNYHAIANECNIPHEKARAWLSILESSYIVFLLQPYHSNFVKRLVKSPKLYFYDTGLLNYLLGIRSADELEKSKFRGHVFENMVLAEYQKHNYHQYLHHDYYFWQDSHGAEVDLLIKKGEQYSVFEIKATPFTSPRLFKGMDSFERVASPALVEKTLIYGGMKDSLQNGYPVISWRNVI